MHGTSLLSTPLPLWTSIITLQSKVLKTVISDTGNYNEIVNNNNLGNNSQKICDKNDDLLRISSLNIRRGLYRKEEELILLMQEQKCDVCSFSEVDIEEFNEKKTF